jgi:hypothetical protein
MLVTRRTAETAGLFKVLLRETAGFAADIACLLRIERRFQQQIRQRKAAGISHTLCLRASLTEIDLMNLTIDDLSEVNRCRLGA